MNIDSIVIERDGKMSVKLYDSELRVMEILWNGGDTGAKNIAALLADSIGWSKTTTYTVIKKCIGKGAVSRSDPGFICHAEISREQAQEYETEKLINRMYGGAADRLVAGLLDSKRLSADEIRELKRLVEELE